MSRYCEKCQDESGSCVYPYYGLAPHTHNLSKTGSVIGSTEINSKDTWPENFDEDPECAGAGTYTHCLSCGGTA